MEIMDQILAGIGSVAAQSAVIGVVLEFALRLIPSKRPLSILHVVGGVAKKAGAICLAIGDLLDKVLPQKLKE